MPQACRDPTAVPEANAAAWLPVASAVARPRRVPNSRAKEATALLAVIRARTDCPLWVLQLPVGSRQNDTSTMRRELRAGAPRDRIASEANPRQTTQPRRIQ